MKEELGDAWLRPNLFRIGASGLLTDIERQLWHNVMGHYSAAHHHPIALRRMYYSIFASPIGDMLLTSDGTCLTGVDFADRVAGRRGNVR